MPEKCREFLATSIQRQDTSLTEAGAVQSTSCMTKMVFMKYQFCLIKNLAFFCKPKAQIILYSYWIETGQETTLVNLIVGIFAVWVSRSKLRQKLRLVFNVAGAIPSEPDSFNVLKPDLCLFKAIND